MTPPPLSTLTGLIESCRSHPPDPPNILHALLTIHEAYGYVPAGAVPSIAHVLGVTEADVAGVLSYYPDLRTAPTGPHLVRVCIGEACWANRGHRVLQAVQQSLRVGAGGTTDEGGWTLETVYCVGNCGVSPTVVIDDDVHGRVAPEQVPALLERYR